MSALELAGLGHERLEPITLTLAAGEKLVVCGPSGSGKTTLLRLIAGLETPRAGTLSLNGRAAQTLPPHLRGVAMLFQGLALWPHLCVRENLRLGGVPDPEATAAQWEVAPFLDRFPDDLSGGERQRVALARALGNPAPLLLLDEPLSQLDTFLREALLQRLAGDPRTQLYVTHDPREALRIAHRILFLEAGRAVQLGPPEELLEKPASLAVARFWGPTNLVPARRESGRIVFALGELEQPGPDGPVTLVIRPEALELGSVGLPVDRLETCRLTDGWEARLRVGELELVARCAATPPPEPRLRLLGRAWALG